MRRPLVGAIAGFGFIAERGHLPAYRLHPERFAIAAVVDTCPERRELARRMLPGARIYEDPALLFAAEAERLDFLDIATPPSEHAALAHAALACGLHVLCEKPITTTAAAAHAVLAHARAARRVFFPSHNYRHAPVVKAVREHLASGDLGTVHLVTLHTFRPTHARGVAEWQPDRRRAQRHAGGGIAMDHGSHSFYLAFDWLRSYPTAVTAHAGFRGGLETEDEFACTVEFPTGTAIAHLTWNAGVRKVMYSLHGDRGALTIDDDQLELAHHDTGEVTRRSIASHWGDASHVTWFASLQAAFAAAIMRGEHAGKEAVDAMCSIELIEAAYASASAGSRLVSLQHATGWRRAYAQFAG